MGLNNSSNTTQAMWLGLGNLISFSFSIISAAILSRFLDKGEYGTYKQVLYVYNTLLVVFTVGLPRAYAYFLARAGIEEGKSIVRKINVILFAVGIIFSLFLFAGAPLIADVLKNQDLEKNIRIFSVTPLLLLPTMGVESVMATYRKSYIATIYTILSRLFVLVCVVLPVITIKATASNAIIGFVCSSALCCVLGFSLEQIPFSKTESVKSGLSVGEIFKFSFPLLIASIWGIIINSSSQFFISRYWGNEEFAEFSNGFIELPFVGMILSATSAVLLPVFSRQAYEHEETDHLVSTWISVIKKAAMIVFPLVVFCFVFAEPIITFLYGEIYTGTNTIKYFRIISFVNFIKIIPFAPLMLALGKVKSYQRSHMVTAILIILMDTICVSLFPSTYAIAVISVFCTYFYTMIQVNTICKTINVRPSHIFPIKFLLKIIFLSVLSAAIGYLFIMIFHVKSCIISLVVGFSAFIVVYIFISNLAGIQYNIYFKSIFTRPNQSPNRPTNKYHVTDNGNK